MISVQIDTKNVNTMLVKLTNNLSQQSFGNWIKRDVNKVVDENTNENFATSGRRAGGWSPLSAATIRKKGHDTILVDTGRLKKEVTTAKANVSGYEASWGDDLSEVYKYHQAMAKRLPVRPMLTWTSGDGPKLKNSLEQHIMRGV
jgi:phage gpG-like protein